MKKRTPDTGLWILQEPLLQDWLHIPGSSGHKDSLLWINGLPGAGKTVLSSTIIEHIQSFEKSPKPKLAYFYVDAIEKPHRTALGICTSAISQLSQQCDEMPEFLLEKYRIARRLGRSKIAEVDGVFEIFQDLVALSPSVYLVVDALDECAEIEAILTWLKSVIQSSPRIRILCLSRETMTIRKSLGHHAIIQLSAASTRSDIERYLVSVFDNLPFVETRIKNRVLRTLDQKAEGMFLLADLSIQMLRRAVHERDVDDILNTIPEGVNEMYKLMIRRLIAEPDARRSLAQRTLRLICFSAQPSTLR